MELTQKLGSGYSKKLGAMWLRLSNPVCMVKGLKLVRIERYKCNVQVFAYRKNIISLMLSGEERRERERLMMREGVPTVGYSCQIFIQSIG